MPPGRQRDLPQLLACRAVLVEVAPSQQGVADGRRPLTEGADPAVARSGRRRIPTFGLPGFDSSRTLGDGPVHEDMPRQPGMDGQAGVQYGTELRRSLEIPHNQVHFEAHSLVDLGE